MHGDLIRVKAPINYIEKTFKTELAWHVHNSMIDLKSLRAIKPISIPDDISNLIAFISLNSPIHNLATIIPKTKPFGNFDQVSCYRLSLLGPYYS